MTTASDSPYPRAMVVAWRLAHLTPWVVLAFTVAYIVSTVLGQRPVVLAFAASGVLVTNVVLFILHGRFPCGLCAARTPLNGPAEAERHAGALNRHHGGVTAIVPLALLLADVLVGQRIYAAWVSASVFTFALTLLVFSYRDEMKHGILRPWCPHCQQGRGYDGPFEEVPVPPAPVVTKSAL